MKTGHMGNGKSNNSKKEKEIYIAELCYRHVSEFTFSSSGDITIQK